MQHARARLRQGIPAGAAAFALLLALIAVWPRPARAQPDCPALAASWREHAQGVWWLPAAAGDADAVNRGLVGNLLAVRDGRRLWLLGSGPSAAAGRAIDCSLRSVAGVPVTDVVVPAARPEFALGAAAMPLARLWVHADVARALARQCPRCIERLREQLAAAAVDLRDADVRPADRLLHGARGRLGPLRWRLVTRREGSAVTVWEVRRTPLLLASTLSWSDGAPDLRDTTLADMTAALASLQQRQAARAGLQVLGQQGPPADAAAIERQRHYWHALQQAVDEAQRGGAPETDVPATLPGVAAEVTADPRHALNWQRAWREREAANLDAQRPAFQRSLR